MKKYANEESASLLYKAYRADSNNQLKQTIKYLEELLQKRTDSWIPRFFLADIYKEKGSYQNALRQGALALTILDDWYSKFQIDPDLKQLSHIIWWYQTDMRLLISYCHEQLKEYQLAANQYEYLIKKGSTIENQNGHCSYLNIKAGNYAKAVKYAQKEITISNAEYAHWNKVVALRNLKKKKEAIAALNVLATFSRKKKTIEQERKLINKVQFTNADNIVKEAIPPKIKPKHLPLQLKGKKLEREDILENLLFLRIESGINIFGRELTVFKNKHYFGKQLFAGTVGFLDLLLEEKKTKTLWVVELKRDHDYNDAFEQTHRYMDWVKKNLAKRGQKVKGIICLFRPSDVLLNQVNNDPEIELHTYEFSFKKLA